MAKRNSPPASGTTAHEGAKAQPETPERPKPEQPKDESILTLSFPPSVLAAILTIASSVRHDMAAIRQLCTSQTKEGRWMVMWNPGSPTAKVALETDPYEILRLNQVIERLKSQLAEERPSVNPKFAAKNPAKAKQILDKGREWDQAVRPQLQEEILALRKRVEELSTGQEWEVELAPIRACERLTLRFRKPVAIAQQDAPEDSHEDSPEASPEGEAKTEVAA